MKYLHVIYGVMKNLKRIRQEMSVGSWIRHATHMGVLVSESDIKQAMRNLESRGYGTYIPGRHGYQCRFKWNGDAEYVRKLLSKEISNAQEAKTTDFVIGGLILELEGIVTKLKAVAQQDTRFPATIEPIAGREAHGKPTSLTSSVHLPSEGCFTSRDVHELNPQRSIVWVRQRLNDMVASGELEAVEIQLGRGRPTKVFGWALAKAA